LRVSIGIWCGAVEGGEGNIRNGNKYLSWAFIEAANFTLRLCAEAKRFYERKKARTNPILARVRPGAFS
jgi:transposase